MKKFIKAVFLLSFFAALALAGIIGFMKFRGIPVPFYVRDPAARFIWTDGEDKGRGVVYWKPFSDKYIGEIDQGSDLFIWASIDRDSETVGFPKIPVRVAGLLLFSNGELESGNSENDEQVGDWRSAFSSRMVTFDNERYRCKVEF